MKKIAIILLALFWVACTRPSDGTSAGDKGMAPESGVVTPAVVYRSTDEGNYWVPFAKEIPHDATVSSFLVEGSTLYAATDFHGVYSIHEGETQWVRLDTDLPERADVNTIAFFKNMLLIGTHRHGMLTSLDGGSHWNSSTSWFAQASIRSLFVHSEVILAGADDGIYASPDGGKTWKHVLTGIQVNGFTELGGKLYAAAMNGALVSQDDGSSWHYVYQPHALHDISNDGMHVYAMTLGEGLLKMNNEPQRWEQVNAGLGAFNFYTFEVKHVGKKLFAAQWHGMYSSANGGKSWEIIRNGLPDSTAFTTLEVTGSGLVAGIGLRKR